MSEPTLAVDSTAIRAAADIVDQAAASFAGSGGAAHRDPTPLTDGCLGRSALAAAVVAAAGRQLARAQDATLGLAERSRTIAGAMQTAATVFEVVESTIGGRR